MKRENMSILYPTVFTENNYYLFSIVKNRIQDSSEKLEVHDHVQQVDGEVERVESETKETEATVEDVIEHHLQSSGHRRDCDCMHQGTQQRPVKTLGVGYVQ